MDKHSDHLQQISEIRSLMNKSSRFLSLSGLSGVSAGLIALAGAAVAFSILDYGNIYYDEYFRILNPKSDNTLSYLLLDAFVVLVLALLSGFYFSYRKARKMRMKFWNPAAKRMLVNLFIPIITGGLLILILLIRNHINYFAPLTLIFYGLGLINAGKYSSYNINYLGFTMIFLGLLSAIFINNGLLFWTLGFGILHIIYGSYLYFRYDRHQEALSK